MILLNNIKQYFQDWGNLWQVFIAVFFGLMSFILWYRDRNKEIKIKELSKQTKYLKELLNQIIKPNLFVENQKHNTGSLGLTQVTIQNSGNSLDDLLIEKLGDDPELIIPKCKSITKNQNVYVSFCKGIKLKFQYKDEGGNYYEQILELNHIDSFFNPPRLLNK
ncbi:MAG: hypothetical protein Q8928_00575 [Bacteroidota bacterium]|nr:hypothetical protein [Bacteroidota bacterium]